MCLCRSPRAGCWPCCWAAIQAGIGIPRPALPLGAGPPRPPKSIAPRPPSLSLSRGERPPGILRAIFFNISKWNVREIPGTEFSRRSCFGSPKVSKNNNYRSQSQLSRKPRVTYIEVYTRDSCKRATRTGNNSLDSLYNTTSDRSHVDQNCCSKASPEAARGPPRMTRTRLRRSLA